MAGFHRLAASVHQQEAAGAVGVLRLARFHAHLPEQRGLLVAGNAADGHLQATEAGLAVDLG
ncbi:hypothetical protein D3C78_1599440 [compost metagenome]